jgi:serine protease Do
MKRLRHLALVSLVVVTLSACHRAAPGAGTDAKDKPNDPGAQADPSAAEDHLVPFTPETRPLISQDDVPLLEQINRENTKVVASALPSVVRISAMISVDPHEQMLDDLPFKLPFAPGMSGGPRENVALYGSGVIISKDGYIVTNYHVVEGAPTVEVQLHDQRTFTARVIASDLPLDLAVLKIDATDLPALPWGDSDRVQVGEQVFAIGNPFNLDDSVTRGIVSAKGRDLPDSNDYEDYIQTDAAINVGNSGGALLNIHGELIGINTAIASFTRGNEGVGFSIPSNQVRYAVEGLLRDGRLVRGYLGVRLPTKIDGGVAQQLGLDTAQGALLAGVQRSSPADLAKLHPVDFITEVDGHKIESISQLRLTVAQLPVGKEVVVNYIRAGTPRSTMVKIAELPKEPEANFEDQALSTQGGDPAPAAPDTAPSRPDQALNGLQVTDLNDKTRQTFGIDDMITSGVVVTGVQDGSPAEGRGLLRGDVIEVACTKGGAIQPLASAGDFTLLTKKLKTDQSVVLLVHHGKTSGSEDRSSIFVYLAPESK